LPSGYRTSITAWHAKALVQPDPLRRLP
jgi:hypothetical protein